MKKLLITVICCLPAALCAQWSIVPSGSVGMSDFKLKYKELSDFKPYVGFGGDVLLRYSIPYSYFYLSVGAGYLKYSSENDATLPDDVPLPEHTGYAYADESVSSVYFPVMGGFYLPERKLSPLVEAGAILNVVIDTGDFTECSGYKDKSAMFSFMVGAGVRYKIYKENALEVKFRYTQTTNMLELSKSYWSYFSLNVAYSISL